MRQGLLDFRSKMKYHSTMKTNSQIEGQDERHRGSRKRARTRADLLKAARQVFARRGYHDASIAEITENADVGVGTFYLHFRDKDEIFSMLLEEGFCEMRKQIAAALVQIPQEQRLASVIRAIFLHAHAQRDLFIIALTGRDGGQLTGVMRAQAGLIEGLTQALEAVPVERQDELNLPLLARFISGMITQGIFWWFEHDEPGPDAMADQVLELLEHGLPAQLLNQKS